MRIFAQKSKATQQTTPTKSMIPARAHFGQSHEVRDILHLHRTIGNQAVQRLLQSNAEEPQARSATTTSARFGYDFSRIPVHANTDSNLQPKPKVNTQGDECEQEAYRFAEQVMRMSDPQFNVTAGETNPHQIQRVCAECENERQQQVANGKAPVEEEEKLAQAKESPDHRPVISPGVRSRIKGFHSGGYMLPHSAKNFFEPRFGHNFSQVRIHSDSKAAETARSIQARAFTIENNIVFGFQEYAPKTMQGKKLLAHELTHVIQQKYTPSPSTVVQRQGLGGPSSADADLAAEREYGDSGAPKAQKCGRPSHCPSGFCDPYRSERLAKYYRAKKSGWLMLGISVAVDSRVAPLWREYLMGGSSPKDLSAQFGKDFTKSPTTRNATSFLHRELEKKLKASPPNVPEFTTESINLSSEIPSAIAKLDDPASPSLTSKTGGRMNFNIPNDIPGNLAGDIGKDQTSCPAGAKPSPFNDERHASGYAEVVRTGNNITVTPMIEYTVKDTIDLCPGDCGTTIERIATVPLSQFEATGISGDVPFTVSFSAPSIGSFTISAPPWNLSNSSSSSKKP